MNISFVIHNGVWFCKCLVYIIEGAAYWRNFIFVALNYCTC